MPMKLPQRIAGWPPARTPSWDLGLPYTPRRRPARVHKYLVPRMVWPWAWFHPSFKETTMQRPEDY